MRDLPLLAGPIAFFMLVFLVQNVELWFVSVVVLFSSYLLIPGLPRGVYAYEFLAFAFTAFVFIRGAVTTRIPHEMKMLRFLAWGYLVVTCFTMAYRGFGVRAIDANSAWGGASYVRIVIGTCFFLIGDQVVLSPRQWKWAFVGYALAGMFPAFVQVTYAVTGGGVNLSMLAPSADMLFSAIEGIGTQGIVRYQVLSLVCTPMLLGALILAPRTLLGRSVLVSVVLLSFALAGFSGHRIAIVRNLGVVATYYTLTGRTSVTRRAALVVVLFLAILVPVCLAAQYLPLSVQRSLAWLPFARISPLAQSGASATTLWRIDVWKRVLEDLPQYLLIGKGFAINAWDAVLTWRYQGGSVEWAYLTHSYHNGPLSMLMDLGAAGFLFGFGFMVMVISSFFGVVRRARSSVFLDRAILVIMAYYITNTVIFVGIHGDATAGWFFFFAAVLRGLVVTRDREREAAEEAQDAVQEDLATRTPALIPPRGARP